MQVFRIYAEKKNEYASHAKNMLSDIKNVLEVRGLKNLRIVNRYDIEGISEEIFESLIPIVFAEPPVDDYYKDLEFLPGEKFFAVEFLPGQFDQRADSCEQCVQFITQKERPRVKSAQIYILDGDVSDKELTKIKKYIINPVESREASLDKYKTLETKYEVKTSVDTLAGFIKLDDEGLDNFINEYSLAMDFEDIKFCRDYFKNTERRDPTITEIRMIDTYWSDHCRHTTFLTNLENIKIHDEEIKSVFDEYIDIKNELGKSEKAVTLMDIATIGAKYLKNKGLLDDLDESEEINACSIKIKADVNGAYDDYILMFKNETHNHPTEIEPFGGAATCLGGAIRDPLSGRSFVFGAMRVTGAANPLEGADKTIPGKLPQRKITTTAAQGYSSYGNQIGLATGHVAEIYHPGYIAKRMEIGAVLGAAPAKNIIREKPSPGDVVILLGGKTGRDGCGGATGSSKSHTLESLENCGAEVQKGNAPEERKIQRLFRNPGVTRLIKRCNDFGAGGISVAVGELADGLEINLDAVPKKYEGLDGTELAISESQERMAVVVASENAGKFIQYAYDENLSATEIAVVTENPRLKMNWKGKVIVDISREFLNSNGAPKFAGVEIKKTALKNTRYNSNTKQNWLELMEDLNICSQKGLVDCFDSVIGAGTVLMPFGGERQLTPGQVLAMKIPVQNGETTTCALMSWGFNPYISEQSPYHAAQYAVIESISKIVAAGGSYKKCRLTFQEYFERLKDDPLRWGKPAAALLGAFKAQLELGTGAIGGKDSMSGSFENIDVPPTLVSFAVTTADSNMIISSEFKNSGSRVILLKPKYKDSGAPDYDSIRGIFESAEKLIASGKVKSARAVTNGGIAEAIAKMSFGNNIGFKFADIKNDLFNPEYGGIILEISEDSETDYSNVIGYTIYEDKIILQDGTEILISELLAPYERKLESVFPSLTETNNDVIPLISYENPSPNTKPKIKFVKPKVLIPVFPGTNSEYDSAEAFMREGAQADIFVINNLTPGGIRESTEEIIKRIGESQIIMFPGGFSAGDEPDGSGKFITAFFRNPRITEEVHKLLNERDGLILGICNGFQALIKLGLVPYGKITGINENSPTLTFNSIGRHQSTMTRIRTASKLSPWLALSGIGDIGNVPVSHGEGRFVASENVIEELIKNGQIATQYVDLNGNPTYDIRYNPNNSTYAIEGITSPDGRVFGKMAHNERIIGRNLCKNIPLGKDQFIFKAGVEYFR